MRFSQAAVFLTALGAATASVLPQEDVYALEKRATSTSAAASSSSKVPDAACTNGPFSRACWYNGYSIATDFDQKFPTTGNTVTYDLTITNSTCNPDGHGARLCLLINGVYPGPTIRATWGDQLVINVHNKMEDNGTSIHWHGVRQYHSPGSDGVNGITECPLAPGDSKTYSFQVTQFGTSWYHAHYSSQYGDGVVGTMIFEGPASANYDYDLGIYPLNEWYYQTAFQINSITSQNLQSFAGPPNASNILINGTNQDGYGNGQYSKVSITNGKKYRLRLVNVAVDNYIRVSLDNHPMLIMASDFIPIKPIYANWVLLGVGQRYDVVINANMTSGNFWFRADVAGDCLSGNDGSGLAVWTYSGTNAATPSSTAFAPPAGQCAEPSPVVPYWHQPVPSGSFVGQELDLTITKAVVQPNGDAIFVWALNTTSIDIAWENPTLSYIMNGNSSYPAALEVIPTTSSGSWNYFLIQTAPNLPPIPHPIHLHGHDFFVIGSGPGQYDPSSATLNWSNPPRRDTETLPGGGWLAIAFNSNNPGTFQSHHIDKTLLADTPQVLGSCTAISHGTSAKVLPCNSSSLHHKSPSQTRQHTATHVRIGTITIPQPIGRRMTLVCKV